MDRDQAGDAGLDNLCQKKVTPLFYHPTQASYLSHYAEAVSRAFSLRDSTTSSISPYSLASSDDI